MGKPHVRFDEGTAPEGASYSTVDGHILIIASSGTWARRTQEPLYPPLKRGVLGATGRYRSLQVKVLLLQITPFKWDSQDGRVSTVMGNLVGLRQTSEP